VHRERDPLPERFVRPTSLDVARKSSSFEASVVAGAVPIWRRLGTRAADEEPRL